MDKLFFYDVDTQNDFMNKEGALYVQDSELIKPNLQKLSEFAIEKNIPVFGSVDKHFGTPEYKEREGELLKYQGPFPDHCMAGTIGQEKIDETNLFICEGFGGREFGGNFIYVPNSLDNKVNKNNLVKGIANAIEPISCFRRYKQGLFFEKQSYDVFTNPAIDDFINMTDFKDAVVYGVATDYCVKAAVNGFQERGIQCYVVEDAIKGITPESEKQAINEMKQNGAKFVSVDDIVTKL